MIYLSTSTDPFVNLALEQQLFETTALPALFLYQNTSCIVIGRAQNPWVECDLHFLHTHNIPLLRRQSGGGTVFHDLGNLNFTLFSDKATFNKHRNLELVITALSGLGATIAVNARHDLLLQDKKISGSAFRETRTRVFHHGTLLFASDLALLRRTLQAPAYTINSKGVASVKSSVININSIYPKITITSVKAMLIEVFSRHYGITSPPQLLSQDDAKQTVLTKYQSDAWRFQHTLPFSETLTHQDQSQSIIEVASGMITHIVTTKPELLKYLNCPYQHFYLERAACKLP